MDRGVPMDRRLALPIFLILVLTQAVAATCKVVDGSAAAHRIIANVVYGPNAYSPFSSMIVKPSSVESLERNTLILTNPQTGEAVEVETSDSAVDPSQALFSNVAARGPFAVSLLLYDTLRISKEDSPYLRDPLLGERFSGRYELREFNQALKSVVEAGLYPVIAPIKSLISKNDPIPNHIASSGYSATIVCASSGCRKELYSLLSKYLNVGASSEMVFEVFGARFLMKAGDVLTGKRASSLLGKFKVKEKLDSEKLGKLDRFIKGIKSKTDDVLNAQLDMAEKKLSSLPAQKQEIIKEAISNPEITSQAIRKLSVEERSVLYRYLATAGEDLENVARLQDGLADILKNTGLSVRDLEEIGKIMSKLKAGGRLEKLEESFLREKLGVNEIILDRIEGALKNKLGAKNLETFLGRMGELKSSVERLRRIANVLPGGERPSEIKELADILSHFENLQDVAPTDLVDIARAANLARRLSYRYAQNAEIVGREIPVLQSQFDVVSDAVTMKLTGESTTLLGKQGFLSKYLVAPMLFYLMRAGPSVIGRPTYSVQGNLDTAYSMFLIRETFSLPPEWTLITLKPLEDEGAVLDILVNHGSDPGDIFKAFLTLTPPGWVDRVFNNILHVKLPGNFLVGEEAERTYHMGPAIAVLSTLGDCEDCVVARGSFGVSFSSPAPVLLSLTENSPREKGSTVISFFRKTNVFANGEKILDVTDEKHSCLKTCNLLNSPGLRSIFRDHPTLAMFSASLVVGYVTPLLTTSIPAQLILTPTLSWVFTKGCYDCVDTTFGYYLHARAPATEFEHNSPEDEITKVLTESFKVLGADVNLENLTRGLEKSRLEKKQVMLYLYFPRAQGVLTGRIVSEWARPEQSLPTGERASPLVLVGEKNVVLSGSTVSSEDGAVNVPAAPLAVPDSTVPGLIIPSQLVEVSPSTEVILRARSSVDYEIDPSISTCLSSSGTDLGELQQVVTTEGSVFFSEEGATAQMESWSGDVSEVVVYSDFRVVLRGVAVSLEDNDVKLREKEVEAGKLKSIVFQDTSIVQLNGSLLAWDRTKATAPKEAVQQAVLSPSDDGRISMSFVPSPDSSPQESEALESMSAITGSVDVLEGSKKTVALLEDDNTGVKYLRIYDKEKNTVVNERIVRILRDTSDPSAVRIDTVDQNGVEKNHTIKVELTSDGTPVLKIDGESGGVLKTAQGDRGFIYFDLETGEWKLVNGVLAPLADAFKNGIKLSFQGGVGTATPSKGIVINTASPGREGGFSLPFLGPEIALLIIGALVIYFIV